MKKILLLAVALCTAGLVSAQSTKVTKSVKHSDVQKAMSMSKALNVTHKEKAFSVNNALENKLMGKKMNSFELSNVLLSAPVDARQVLAGSRKAGAVQAEYTGTGAVSGNGTAPWTMLSGAEGDTLYLLNVIPNPYPTSLTNGVAVEYTLEGNTIKIEPQLVFSSSSWNAFIFGDNYTIELELGEDGSITVPDGEVIYYGAFSGEEFDESLTTYLGYIEYVKNINYLLPGQKVAPKVEYEPAGVYLHANVGPTFYGYTSTDYAIIPPFATISLVNQTIDAADTWSWTLENLEAETSETGAERDFSFNSVPTVYSAAVLVGASEDLESTPFILGATKDNENAYVYAGGSESDFAFSDGTYATMSMANTDNSLAYYSSPATPDLNTNRSINAFFLYQGKPEAPLYITGVNLAVSKFEIKDPENFTLKCKIVKSHMQENGWPTVGDVIAEADLSADGVTVGYDNGAAYNLVRLDWTNFYVLDEDGLSVGLDHLFIEDEFAVIIDGWDNGTFSCAHMWAENDNNDGAGYSWFFYKDGDEINYDNMYRFGYQTRPLLGFDEATYGYLYTENSTSLNFDKEGGETVLTVEPMMVAQDESENWVTDIWVENEDEFPDWVDYDIVNENYKTNEDGALTESSFGLKIIVDPLPANEASRTGELVFAQEGALLKVTISQGADGISTATVTGIKADGRIYNVAGQRVSENYKGIVVKNGVKMLQK
ncbi:MAG: hypothetical protein IJ064_00945 [Bacteroidaceae bacterium]|nr:hypothetical protein [Bacteroidaceae bacterium]